MVGRSSRFLSGAETRLAKFSYTPYRLLPPEVMQKRPPRGPMHTRLPEHGQLLAPYEPLVDLLLREVFDRLAGFEDRAATGRLDDVAERALDAEALDGALPLKA